MSGQSHEPFNPNLSLDTRQPAEPGDPYGLVTPRLRPKFQDRIWLHVLLFALTVLTTNIMGQGHYLGFTADFGELNPEGLPDWPVRFLQGFWYGGTVLVILGAHELGHYFTCRYYQVDASRPFFIPALGFLAGTFGAFIRIREPIPSKRMLFDIGIAGPIAGFVFVVPALVIGVAMSRTVPLPPDFTGYSLGEPLLFQGVVWAIWGVIPDGFSLNLHPMAFAAWFGLLATALNLFPIGQLDGGHISYAVLGRGSTRVTIGMVGVAIGLALFVSLSWVVWSTLLVVMLLVFGPRHPPTMDEDVPLDPARLKLALFALVMLILCFTPNPIEVLDLVRGPVG